MKLIKSIFHIICWVRDKSLWLLQSLLRMVPVLNKLADCTLDDHKKGAKEFAFALLFSTVTFWLTSIILLTHNAVAGKSYAELLASTYANGELLIFSVSFIGPIFLATLIERPSNKAQFPGKDWHMLILISLAIIASALFAQLKSQSLAPGVGAILNMDVVRYISYTLAGLAVSMRYITFVYQKNMAAFDEEFGPKGDKAFAENYIKHAEGRGQ